MKDQEFETILRQAMQPPVSPEEIVVPVRVSGKGTYMTMKNMLKKGCFAAAVLVLLTTTVYAAGLVNIKTLRSGSVSRAYDNVIQAEEKAGFAVDDLEIFSNGYRFDSARVEQTKALDDKDKVRFIYSEIRMELVNASGEKLNLTAHQRQEGVAASSLDPDQVRKIGEVTLEYRLHHYKFVPEDYALTEEDKSMLEKPGYFLSYGSKEVVQKDVAFLNWEKDGICYTLMDSDGSETAESLFAMAEELILSGK